jgi:hypothetical protein
LHVSSDEAQSQAFERCFDRSSRYAEVVKVVSTLKSAFSMADPTSISRTLIKCKRDFAAIASLDFFPSEARDKAAQAIEDCDAAVRGLLFPKSKELSSTQQLRAREKYFRRFWVTRSPLFADRLACAWLIRRFIDAEGKILWINRDQKPHENAVTFGFQGAAFSNSSGEVTYEVLLGAFGLTRDPALKRIATIIHALDIGGEPVPEAAGVESLLQGAQRRATDEQTLLSETEKTFDLLYDAYFVQPGKS